MDILPNKAATRFSLPTGGSPEKIIYHDYFLVSGNSFYINASMATLRKHAYSNTLKILQLKKAIFQIKNSDIFHISSQNIDCGYSLEPPLRVPTIYKKIIVYPCKPQFYYLKVGVDWVKLIWARFRDTQRAAGGK